MEPVTVKAIASLESDGGRADTTESRGDCERGTSVEETPKLLSRGDHNRCERVAISSKRSSISWTDWTR
jgi:hypothetical protein